MTDDAPGDRTDPDSIPDGPGADAVAEGIAQFQKAAVDALHAARAMLDAAETIVSQPGAVESLLSTVTDLAREATETVSGFAAGAARASSRADGHRVDDDNDGGFETIDLS